MQQPLGAALCWGASPSSPTCLLPPTPKAGGQALLHLPQGQGGDHASRKDPQRVRRCIITLFMGWVEYSVGKQWSYFCEESSPRGQGLGRLVQDGPHLARALRTLPGPTPRT